MEVLFFFADRIYYNYPNSFLFTSSVICRRYSLNSYRGKEKVLHQKTQKACNPWFNIEKHEKHEL